MTNDKILSELIIAIGYALDASNSDRPASERKTARNRSEKILTKVMEFLHERNPPKRRDRNQKPPKGSDL